MSDVDSRANAFKTRFLASLGMTYERKVVLNLSTVILNEVKGLDRDRAMLERT
jgi:hypothetical protein